MWLAFILIKLGLGGRSKCSTERDGKQGFSQPINKSFLNSLCVSTTIKYGLLIKTHYQTVNFCPKNAVVPENLPPCLQRKIVSN